MIDVTKTILRLGTSLDKRFMYFGYVLIFFPSIFWYLNSFRESTIIGFEGKWDTYYFLAILSSTIFLLMGLAIIFGTRKTIEKRIGK